MTLRIGVTPGEPAGIGPDLVIALAQQDWPVELVVCANAALLQQRAAQLNLPLQLLPYSPDSTAMPQQAGTLTIADYDVAEPVVAGQLNAANGRYVIDTLTFAGEKSISGEFAAIVTGPVHKGIINKAGIPLADTPSFLLISLTHLMS